MNNPDPNIGHNHTLATASPVHCHASSSQHSPAESQNPPMWQQQIQGTLKAENSENFNQMNITWSSVCNMRSYHPTHLWQCCICPTHLWQCCICHAHIWQLLYLPCHTP